MRRIFTFYLPSIALGAFLARFFYELDPLRLVFLGDWPGVIALVIICLLAVHLLVTRYASSLSIPVEFTSLAPLLLLFVYVFWPEVDLRWALVLLIGSLVLVGREVTRSASYSTRWLDLILVVMVLGLYLATLGDHVGQADTFEWQVVMPQLGIGHPTGYPLFVMIGKLFSLIPIGSMAWRTNLVSVLFAVITVVLVYRLLIALKADRVAAMLAALALASSGVFWSQSVEVEVYTLDAALVTAMLVLLVKILTERATLRQRPTLIYGLCLVLGLAVSHHLNSVIVVPAIVLTLIFVKLNLTLKSWLIALGCLLLGLTPWLYILIRWPALHNGTPMEVSAWLQWIFAQRFGGAFYWTGWLDSTRWGIVGRITLNQFGTAGALLALLGFVVLLKRAWRVALITLSVFAGYIFFALIYNVPDVDVFFMPAFVIMAGWIGLAFSYGWDVIGGIFAANRPVARQLAVMAAALLPLSLIATNYAQNDLQGQRAEVENWGRYVLSLPIPDHAAILVDSEKIAPLYYLQVTEGLRPDLDILVLGDEARYRQELDQRLSAGQPVYLARFLPNLPYRLRSLGPLVEVSGEPLMTTPTTARTLNADFNGRLKLIGVTDEPGDPYRITLAWQATSAERANYHVRLRLLDSAGQIWWEDQGAHPVGGYYPTGTWAQGEFVTDFHEIKIEPFVPPGTYTLAVGLFTPFRDDALPVNGQAWLTIASVDVQSRTPESLAHAVRIVSGERVITSVDALGDVPPANETTQRLTAEGAGSNAVLAISMDNTASTLSTTQVVRAGESRLAFRTPETNGLHTVRLKFDTPSRCRWLAPLTTDCVLGTLMVAGEAIGNAINFDNQVLLTSSKVDRTSLQPGKTIKVDLTWRGLKAWNADYTAFVHLVGPDGKVHGQVDQWPVQGTLPTSSWGAGQVVDDPYVVTLLPDAPHGTYQVEVGWYLLATLRRLSVLDTAGHPSDDKVIISEFKVP